MKTILTIAASLTLGACATQPQPSAYASGTSLRITSLSGHLLSQMNFPSAQDCEQWRSTIAPKARAAGNAAACVQDSVPASLSWAFTFAYKGQRPGITMNLDSREGCVKAQQDMGSQVIYSCYRPGEEQPRLVRESATTSLSTADTSLRVTSASGKLISQTDFHTVQDCERMAHAMADQAKVAGNELKCSNDPAPASLPWSVTFYFEGTSPNFTMHVDSKEACLNAQKNSSRKIEYECHLVPTAKTEQKPISNPPKVQMGASAAPASGRYLIAYSIDGQAIAQADFANEPICRQEAYSIGLDPTITDLKLRCQAEPTSRVLPWVSRIVLHGTAFNVAAISRDTCDGAGQVFRKVGAVIERHCDQR
jgi:hypothetical protein